MTPRTHLPELAAVRALCRSGAARTIRVSANISLREMAQSLDPAVSPTTIMRWENGLARPSGEQALAYGRALQSLLSPSRAAS